MNDVVKGRRKEGGGREKEVEGKKEGRMGGRSRGERKRKLNEE